MNRWTFLAVAAFVFFGVAVVVAQDDGKGKNLTTIGPVKAISTGFFTVDALGPLGYPLVNTARV